MPRLSRTPAPALWYNAWLLLCIGSRPIDEYPEVALKAGSETELREDIMPVDTHACGTVRTRLARLILAMILSFVVHGTAAVCAYAILSAGCERLIPVFQSGQSDIVVTLVGSDDATGDISRNPKPELAPPAVKSTPRSPEREPVRVAPVAPPPPLTLPQRVPDVAKSISPPSAPDTGAPAASSSAPHVNALEPGPAGAEIQNESMGVSRPKHGSTGNGNVATEAGPGSDALPDGARGAVLGINDINPHYPLGARARGEEGVVTVKMVVNDRGRAEKAEVLRSSSFPSLDRAAIEAVNHARFITKGGAPAQGGEAVLSIRFKLVK